MIAAHRGLGKVTSRERKAMHPARLRSLLDPIGIVTNGKGSREGQTVQSKPRAIGGTYFDSGLEIKTSHSPSGPGRSFFLTSLFIELIEASASRRWLTEVW